MMLLHISQSKSRGISYLNVRQLCRWDDNPEIRDRLNVNKSTYHNKRPRERFICFIRGAKWTKTNKLNGPSRIHDTSTWLSQSIQSIRHVCCRLGMQKKSPLKVLQNSFRPLRFPVDKCFPASLTHAQTLPLAVRENEESLFISFQPLADETNHEHLPKTFFKVIRKSL